MKSFCQIHNLKNLLDIPARYKNLISPSCVDLIITNNNPKSFQNSCTFDYNEIEMTITLLKLCFAKQKPRVLNYCNYKFFKNSLFGDQVLSELSHSILQINNKDLKQFKETCLLIQNTIASLKSIFIRANQAHFVNKEIQRAVVVRSRRQNEFLKSRFIYDKKVYNKQRNNCDSLLRKTKKAYYSNLNVENIADNKKFWKTVKSFFSDK